MTLTLHQAALQMCKQLAETLDPSVGLFCADKTSNLPESNQNRITEGMKNNFHYFCLDKQNNNNIFAVSQELSQTG